MGKLSGIAIAALCLIGLLIGVAAVVIVQYHYSNEGTIIEPLEVSLANEPLEDLDVIDWTDCVRGITTPFGDLTVKNIGSITVTISLTTGTMPTGLTIEWTPDSLTLAPEEVATAPLSLTVASDAPLGDFTFDIVLTVETVP